MYKTVSCTYLCEKFLQSKSQHICSRYRVLRDALEPPAPTAKPQPRRCGDETKTESLSATLVDYITNYIT